MADDLPRGRRDPFMARARVAGRGREEYIGLLSAGYYIDLSYPASNHFRVDFRSRRTKI